MDREINSKISGQFRISDRLHALEHVKQGNSKKPFTSAPAQNLKANRVIKPFKASGGQVESFTATNNPVQE